MESQTWQERVETVQVEAAASGSEPLAGQQIDGIALTGNRTEPSQQNHEPISESHLHPNSSGLAAGAAIAAAEQPLEVVKTETKSGGNSVSTEKTASLTEELSDDMRTQSTESSQLHDAVSPDAVALQNSEDRSTSPHNGEVQDDEPTKAEAQGTAISEGHPNYVLMYDMLTGIRNSVSRCVAKPDRGLEKADFTAKDKLLFDIWGNELTPSSKYEFKFVDYGAFAFRYIREHFGIGAADYLMSLTDKYVLSELGSPGKSGSFFYYSQDYRFTIKTIHHSEHRFLMNSVEQYYHHVKAHPNSLLARYYGLHRVKLPGGKKIHFVVMGNVFPPHRDIHESFDLKGSLIGRALKPEACKKPRAVQKDLNWMQQKRKMQLGPEKRELFLAQCRIDVRFLEELGVMDYSLLVGMHYLKRGNSEAIRNTSLKVYEPDTTSLTQSQNTSTNVRRVLEHSGVSQLGLCDFALPSSIPPERKGCVFYSDDGGYRATSERGAHLSEVYYLGIIDNLTPYNALKRGESVLNRLKGNNRLRSAVNAQVYGERFLRFMQRYVVPSPNETSEMEPREAKVYKAYLKSLESESNSTESDA